jgi:hypothetical protein
MARSRERTAFKVSFSTNSNAIHIVFAYYSPMQLSAPQPRKHRVLMTFSFGRGSWFVVFWDNDRMRTPLPRKARFTTDEAMVEFIRRAGGAKNLEDKNILEMMMQQRRSGEVDLEITEEQYDKLRRA